jgi:HSP20 family molecular chaperone IbpA
MKEKNLSHLESSPLSRENKQKNDQYISASADIFETEEGLTMIADMPGLDDKSLDISIDQGVLTIKGDAPAGAGDCHHREFAMAGYWRQFLLTDTFDAGKAEASIKQGVMTLKIPKTEAAKPKRIAVTVH